MFNLCLVIKYDFGFIWFSSIIFFKSAIGLTKKKNYLQTEDYLGIQTLLRFPCFLSYLFESFFLKHAIKILSYGISLTVFASEHFWCRYEDKIAVSSLQILSRTLHHQFSQCANVKLHQTLQQFQLILKLFLRSLNPKQSCFLYSIVFPTIWFTVSV